MQKIKRIFLSCFLVLLSMLLLVACGTKITEEDLRNLVFNDITVSYDGEVHSIYVENIYEDKGVVITYSGNDTAKSPGKYTVTALISYEDIKISKFAFITIEKMESVLTAPSEQVVYLSNSLVNLEYTLNNDQQTVTVLNENKIAVTSDYYSKKGTYQLELYAKTNTYYKESNHVTVTLKVVDSKFDIEFKNQTVVENGEEQTILLNGNLPSGYTVDYTNNKGTNPGKYLAKAEIKDSNGVVVETHTAVLNIQKKDNEEFAKYLDEVFFEYLEGDQLSINVFCENPENFGFEHYDAYWYSFEAYTEDTVNEYIEYYTEALEELKTFNYDDLSPLQQSMYKTIEEFYQYYVNYYSIEDVFFMELTYITQFGGYVSEFTSYMESYTLRTEEEVKDLIKYFEASKDAFVSYLDYAQAKLDKGYAYSDFTITEMRKYLKDLLDQKEEFYLEDILYYNIGEVTFLTDEQKEEYKQQLSKAIEEYFMPGVQELYDGLEQFLGKLAKEDQGYYATYEKGKELYELVLKKILGMPDLEMANYIVQLDKAIEMNVTATVEAQKEIIAAYNITTWNQFEKVIDQNPIFSGTPEEMMEFLKKFAPTIVKELQSDPNIVIKEMDESAAKVSNAVAFYRKSPLDNTGSEYVTLNPIKIGQSTTNDTLGTLAHEGYPGHLYAYVYSKELGLSNIAVVMTSTAHAEGWATYVQLKLFEYAKLQSNDKRFNTIMEYLYQNQLSGYLLETRIDVGIHYQDWDVEKVAEYLDKLGYNSGAAQELYDLLIEMPTQYAAYGYGKVVFNELHEKAKSILGSYYDEIEFNAMLLSKGWTGLDLLKQTYEEYMIDKCYECGIEYKK